MMLVASLFISGSYDKIAGYAPGSQVTDHNAVDLDQKVMETHLKAGDFVKALDVYEKGGNSKSYAAAHGPGDRQEHQEGRGDDRDGSEQGRPVSGKAYDDYAAGSTSIRFQYSTGNTQWKLPTARTLRGTMTAAWAAWIRTTPTTRPPAASTTSKAVTVTLRGRLDGPPSPPAPSSTRTAARSRASRRARRRRCIDDCPGCPYEDYTKFYEYYGSHTYADDWVTAALTGDKTEFTRGNIDFSKAIKSYDGTAETAARRATPTTTCASRRRRRARRT